MNPSPPPFDALRERLLRGGLSPRAVRRYVQELQEHFEDVVQAELASDAPREAAERSARARLGAEDDLLRSALARRELHAAGARWPAAIYGAGPALPVALRDRAHALRGRSRPRRGRAVRRQPPADVAARAGLRAVCHLRARAARGHQRSAPRGSIPPTPGPALAARRAALIALLAGTTRIQVAFADMLGAASQLSLSSSLLPALLPFAQSVGPLELPELVTGLVRAAAMLA